MANIYLASSWRNNYYDATLNSLRNKGHKVYDFRNPQAHFLWSDIDKDWENWSVSEYILYLSDPKAQHGFNSDMKGINDSDICVLLLPCGRSAHTEAGYMKGQGKKVFVIIPEKIEPELMYNIFDGIYTSMNSLLLHLNEL